MTNDLSRLTGAIIFASQKHQDQRRENSTEAPYINHPLSVMHRLVMTGVIDLNTLIAAVLHDVVEDTDATYEEIATIFGYEVCHILRHVTNDKNVSKLQMKKEQISKADEKPLSSRLIKLADKLDNMSDLCHDPPTKWKPIEIIGYFVWCYFVVEALMDANNGELRRLPAGVHLYDALQELFRSAYFANKDKFAELLYNEYGENIPFPYENDPKCMYTEHMLNLYYERKYRKNEERDVCYA